MNICKDFPGGSHGKESACNVRYLDQNLIPGLGRSPGGGHGYPMQYSCLENPMDRGAWWAPWDHKESDMTERLNTAYSGGCFMEKNILISNFSKTLSFTKDPWSRWLQQRTLMNNLSYLQSKDAICRGRSMTMPNSEPVIPALLEDCKALWRIFLGSSNNVHVRRECCLELGKSWCGTILPILETKLLPRLQTS